jgi:hypothetical protein
MVATTSFRKTDNPGHAPGGCFFDFCRAARRVGDVDVGAFIAALFFGGFDATGALKRDAHFCSRRRTR